jgi:hypothetical protein
VSIRINYQGLSSVLYIHHNWKRTPVLSRKRQSVHEKSVKSFHGVDECVTVIVKLGFHGFPWGDSPVFPTVLTYIMSKTVD